MLFRSRQHEILERVAAGRTLPGDSARLADVGWTMTDASLCGLGQTAASAVLSAMKLWPAMFEAAGPKAATGRRAAGKGRAAKPANSRPAKKTAVKRVAAEKAKKSGTKKAVKKLARKPAAAKGRRPARKK